MTPREFEREIKRRVVATAKALAQAERDNIALAKSIAKSYSQGPYSSAQLASMGHPYSRRAPRPPMPSGFINVQRSRRFVRSFSTVQRGRHNNNRIVTELNNNSPEWQYLKYGTRYMIKRPLGELVLGAVHVKRDLNLAIAIQQNLY